MLSQSGFIRRRCLPIVLSLCSIALWNQGFSEEKLQESSVNSSPSVKTKEELITPQNIFKISQSYGYMIGKSIDSPLIKLNLDAVIQGIKDQQSGKSPLMTEQEYEEFVTELQEVSFREDAQKNLNEAEKFLLENGKKKGVQNHENGKLQILIEKAGSGSDAVTESVTPVIHYSGSYQNGTIFGSSKEPFPISLDQTLPGFKKGVLGMKVGEKRRIFIHPDLGYGISGQLIPNALLIFDVELIRIDPLAERTEDAQRSDMNFDSEDEDEILDEEGDFDSEFDGKEEEPVL